MRGSETDTIAAIASGAQAAGVGVIRISGLDALDIARAVFPALPPAPRPKLLHYGRVVDAGSARTELDSGFAVYFAAPFSFTGEETVELQVHGGALNMRRVLEAVLTAGARAASPGEFTRRAFLNGKLDLTQAEAILDIVHARTEAGLAAAQAQLGGALSAAVGEVRRALVGARAHVEVNIDFAEEDVPLFGPDALAEELDAPARALARLCSSFASGRVLREGVSVVIAGRPNAGKSSLFNALLKEHRAIVAPVAGTTRDFLEESVDLEGMPVVLVDTAGLRESQDIVEQMGVERSQARIVDADIVVWVVDAAAPPSIDDFREYARLPERQRVLAFNKCDLGVHPAWELEPMKGEGMPVSALCGEGVEGLVQAVLRQAGALGDGLAGQAVVMRARHQAALVRARDATLTAMHAVTSGLPPEIVAGEIQLALDALAELVGATTPDDVLEYIFREFCIGK